MDDQKWVKGRGYKALYAVYEKGTEVCIMMDVTLEHICSSLGYRKGYVKDMMCRGRGKYEFCRTGTRFRETDTFFDEE